MIPVSGTKPPWILAEVAPPVTVGDGERNLVAASQRPGASARSAPCRPDRAIALAEAAAEASLRQTPVESVGTSAMLSAGTGNCFASEPA
jgi:hypothetical protein